MSKLINQSRLQQFATALWTKIKGRYDDAFINAEITESTVEEKKLKFTKIKGGDKVEVNLKDYARLTDKNDFKQDVSADNVAIIDNINIGTNFGVGSKDRSLGFRRLTTDSFSDGYVDHIRINIPNSNTNTNAGTTSRWFVWAIKQGANDKNGDTVTKVVCNDLVINVDTINENSQEKKFVRIPVKDSFENGTYFIVRCTTHELEIVNSINPEYSEDVVNMNKTQPPMVPGTAIDWTAGDNVKTSNTVIMQLFGRESIGSLSLKLKQTQSDSSLYVKHSECTDGTGSETKAGKVVKLDRQGKLDKTLLPKIAINEYYPISAFNNTELANVEYENGDVVVVTTNGQVSKRYLCINKRDGVTNSTEDFVELNSKDGVVTSLNNKRGDLNLALESTETHVKLKVNGDGEAAETQLEIITTGEIDAMIAALPTT